MVFEYPNSKQLGSFTQSTPQVEYAFIGKTSKNNEISNFMG